MLQKHIKNQSHTSIKRLRSLVLIAMALGMAGSVPIVAADAYDNQINAIKNQSASTQSALNGLQATATSYQDAINQLSAQINGLQASIAVNQDKQAQVTQQIADDQAEIALKKSQLGADVQAMYVDGQISTIEELASSSDLSQYIDKEEYRSTVQNQLNDKITQITALEAQLQQQKIQLDQLVLDQQNQQNQLASSKQQQQSMLAYNQSQQDAYSQQLQANQAQISSLLAQQLAANRRINAKVNYSGACGGSYPVEASGPNGSWGCNYGKDQGEDNWGMYNRECVSYTAWKVYQTFGYMPAWGVEGVGNAYQWPGDAQADHIPTGSAPRVHSVAIAPPGGYYGSVGHAMWVESVNGDGSITVSQYNFGVAGAYSTMTVSPAGFTFIYF